MLKVARCRCCMGGQHRPPGPVHVGGNTSIRNSFCRAIKTGNNLTARSGERQTNSTMATQLTTVARGSVQQRLSAAGGVLGYFRFRGAADRRYSLGDAARLT